jgi:hypothetical protein
MEENIPIFHHIDKITFEGRKNKYILIFPFLYLILFFYFFAYIYILCFEFAHENFLMKCMIELDLVWH